MDSKANDFEARRTVWDSKVPVEFSLDNSESVLATHQSCFMMLSRVSYFPVYLDKTLKVLTSGDASEEQLLNVWLQFDGQILKWHYPIGVLYDIYHGNAGDGQTTPWPITVHLKNFPDELIRCRTKETLKFCFLQSLKEACQLKLRSNIAASMTKDEHGRLFDGLCNDRFNDFWMVNDKLMGLRSSSGEEQFSTIPARFYESSYSFRQLLLHSKKQLDDGNMGESLLIDALHKVFPDYAIETDFEAVTHGIVLPLNTPLIWLARNLVYPDNFVHIPYILRFMPQRWRIWFDSVLYPTCPVNKMETTNKSKTEEHKTDGEGETGKECEKDK
ncbi:hypothetical protein niasHT_007566 [Heterodera trifolii]|uniref:Autophagy protein 5 n=1 Tax=Heterodera trifolii TaxID=157864 RepID=A0ABD2LPZ4_9BILA